MKTQAEQILNYLQRGWSLTPKDALDLFGTMRLGARIYDLRKAGHDILEERVSVPGKNGTMARVSKYFLNRKKKGELF